MFIEVNNVVSGKVNLSELPEKYVIDNEYNKNFSFESKFYSCHNRILYLNELIKKIYNTWELLMMEPNYKDYSSDKIEEYILMHNQWENKFILSQFEHEEFITQLRKVMDDLIVMYCVAKKETNKNGLIYDGVSDIKCEIKDKFSELLPFQEFFNRVINISNGIKHCVANSVPVILGIEEPVLSAMYWNRDDKRRDFVAINLSTLVTEFNGFYQYIDAYIKKS